jgi:6-pyruvoyltetrahydropterin/6-carboxytetrahydropterin synthase
MKATKIVSFCASHRLSNYAGNCRRCHGHNFKIEATIESANLTDVGFVIDFGELKTELKKITDMFDHKMILKTEDLQNQKIATVVPEDWITWVDFNPTAENLAQYIADTLKENIVCDKIYIKFWETDTSFAEYSLNCKD